MLRTPQELWLGRGLGRYVDNYALSAPIEQRPGDFRLRQQDGNGYLTTVAGNHMLGWGDVLRISQRVSIPEGPAQVRFRVRAEKATTLHFEVCMKHLLYDAGCLSLGLEVPAKSRSRQNQVPASAEGSGGWW